MLRESWMTWRRWINLSPLIMLLSVGPLTWSDVGRYGVQISDQPRLPPGPTGVGPRNEANNTPSTHPASWVSLSLTSVITVYLLQNDQWKFARWVGIIFIVYVFIDFSPWIMGVVWLLYLWVEVCYLILSQVMEDQSEVGNLLVEGILLISLFCSVMSF